MYFCAHISLWIICGIVFLYKYISLRICGIVFLYEYISLRVCGIVFCTHINLYHKYFVLVSDKYGDEGLVMLIKCIFLKEEFQVTQEEGFLIEMANLERVLAMMDKYH